MFIRQFTPTDFNFVTSSWLKSFRESDFAGVVANDIYYATYLHTIESLVKSGADINVLDDYGTIAGYVCCNTTEDGIGVIHYIYVKKDYRSDLAYSTLVDTVLGTKPGFYTFRTPKISKVLTNWRWAPEIARRK